MKMNRLSFEDFKGGTANIELSGVDLFIGANGSGKTRILQAMQLAVSGTVPHPIEDRNIDAMELFTRDFGKSVMRVGVELPELNFVRNFELNKKGDSLSCNQSIEFSDSTETGAIPGGKRIKDLLGEFAPMLDVHKFIRMSDQERAQMMLNCGAFDSEKWSAANIRAIVIDSLYEHFPEEAVTAIGTEFNKVSGFEQDPRNGLIKLLDNLKKHESDSKKKIKTFSSTAQGAVALNVTDGKTSLRPISTITEEIEATLKSYGDLQQSLSDARSSKAQFDKNQTEKANLERMIAEQKSEEVIDADIAKLAAERDALFLQEAIDPKELVRLEGLEREIVAGRESHAKSIKDIASAWAFHSQAVGRLEKLKGGKCPTCGKKCTAKDIKAVEDEISLLRVDVEQLQEFDKSTQGAFEAYLIEQGEIKERHRLINDRNNAAPKEIKSLETQIESLKSQKTAAAGLTDRLNALSEFKYDSSINITEAEAQLEALSNKGKTLREEQTQRTQYDTKILMAKESAANMKKEEAELETVKATIEKVKEIRWSIVRESLAPISATATSLFNSFTTFQGNPKFAFQFEDLRGNEVFKFGWEVENEMGMMFIDFDSLSTAQQLFTLVSVLSPLISLGNPKFKCLLLDNVEVVHVENRMAFLGLLTGAKAICGLDNVLIASSSDFPGYTGVNMVRL